MAAGKIARNLFRLRLRLRRRTPLIAERLRYEAFSGPSAAPRWDIVALAMGVNRHFAVSGHIQREGEVVHLVAHRLTDLSQELVSVGRRDATFPLPHGRGDELHHGSAGIDPRSAPKGSKPRDIYDAYGHIDQIKLKARNFR